MRVVERGFRDAALRDGSSHFCDFLSALAEETPVCPEHGTPMARVDTRSRTVTSMMGDGVLYRGYYACPECGAHAIPKDAEVGVDGTRFTPGVRRSVGLLASAESFEWSSDTLGDIGGVNVSAKECQRISEEIGAGIEAGFVAVRDRLLEPVKAGCDGVPVPQFGDTIPIMYCEIDGTGVPMRKDELEGRKGKRDDGGSSTREVKLGCVFTQAGHDEEGNPVREEGSTSYFGAIENSEEFGNRLYANAMMRGLNRAERVVLLGDGAIWIRNVGQLHLPGATHIVDLFHAKEHICKLAKRLVDGEDGQKNLQNEWIGILESGKAITLAKRMRSYPVDDIELRKARDAEVKYFFSNYSRMRYDRFRDEGLFVGSGVIEAGCKTVVGKRLKQSGMFWSVDGANAITALRCAALSCDADLDGYHWVR